MSTIPTKQICGDVSVSRNANIGNRAEVKGDMTVGHNLTVRGWLEAPNVKGPLKGLFKDRETLLEAYADPEPGWWALVGEGFPAGVWRADATDGKCRWRDTEETWGELAIYPDELEKSLAEAMETVSEFDTRIGECEQSATELGAAIEDLEGRAGNLETGLDSTILHMSDAEERLQDLQRDLTGLTAELGNLQTQVGKSLQELRAEAEGLAAAVAAAARTARLATPQRVADEAALEAAAAKAEVGQQFYVPEEG